MAEKGGEGFSLAKGGKSAPKPSAQSKGDSMAKSKKGRAVHFASEDTLGGNIFKSNGKSDTPSRKGDSAKGGKGDKVASAPKPPPPLELRVEQELPETTKCLMDCEAAEILQAIQEQMVVLSEDPAIKLPVSFDRGLMYANRFKFYKDSQAVQKILEPLKKLGVSDGETCMIANFTMESVDEVFALVPSLKGKKSKLKAPLRSILDELAKLRDSAEKPQQIN